MRTVTSIDGVRQAVATARAGDASVALVPTMGALHDGHLALVRRARDTAGFVVVSIFVNPTQFDRADDLASYPRELDEDVGRLQALDDAAPDLVFAPAVAEMYPTEPRTTVRVAELTNGLCGAHRPGHFDGVATVVTKLFSIVRPDVAVFGRKDRQQLAVVEKLATDLDLGVRVEGVVTVREADGLAVSSRNVHLDPRQRTAARALSVALAEGVRRARAERSNGILDAGSVTKEVATSLAAASSVDVEYVEVVDPATFAPPDGPVAAEGRLVVAVAAYVGGVRLIDNVEIGVPEDEDALLAAVDAAG